MHESTDKGGFSGTKWPCEGDDRSCGGRTTERSSERFEAFAAVAVVG